MKPSAAVVIVSLLVTLLYTVFCVTLGTLIFCRNQDTTPVSSTDYRIASGRNFTCATYKYLSDDYVLLTCEDPPFFIGKRNAGAVEGVGISRQMLEVLKETNLDIPAFNATLWST